MTFDELWTQVKGLPDTAKIQIPGVLSLETKRKLSRKAPEEVTSMVTAAIDEVNHGSIAPLDELIRKRI